MATTRMYLVGGAVRDTVLGLPVKDYDYTVVAEGIHDGDAERGYGLMREELKEQGFHIFLETPRYFTIRAKFPKGHPREKVTADFVLARKEGPYSDGRRPDWVKVGTLEDDIMRRDFTVNALAMEEGSDDIIDLVGGLEDLRTMTLRAVGDPTDRLTEDALRAFRAVRFAVTKGFALDADLKFALRKVNVLHALQENISAERIKDELHRCFAYDSVATVSFLIWNYPESLSVMRDKGIWLEPTMKSKPGIKNKKDPVNTDGVCTGFGDKN